ncbi:hypothetical protein ACVIYH_002413 [Bradyrhizobium diazoefficiens]
MIGLSPFVLDMACAVAARDEDHRGGTDLGKMAGVVTGGGEDLHGGMPLRARRFCDACPQARIEGV